MTVNAYAVVQDVKNWLSPTVPTQADAELQRLIDRATEAVDQYLRHAAYQMDTAGENPTDADLIVALRKATCAQVTRWISDGTDLSGLENWTTYVINGVTVTRPAASRPRICQESRDLLATVSHLFRNVWVT